MPDGSQANAVDNGSYHQFAFLPGLPSGWPSIRFQGIDDNTGIWYDPDTKSIKVRFAGVDTYTFDDTGGLTTTVQMSFNAENGVVAFAGGGQANATQLGAFNYHRIATCATLGDSVKLPAATVGAFHVVRNDGAVSANIFPQTGETIDGLPVNTSVPLHVKSSAIFHCVGVGAWISVGKQAFTGSAAFAPYFDMGETTAGMISVGRNDIAIGSKNCAFGYDGTRLGFKVANSGGYCWSSTTTANGVLDVLLFRDAAGILAQMNSTNAQLFRIYNTFTDASNYERLEVGANPGNISANTFGMIVTNAGTGAARDMYLGTQGAGNLNFRVSAANKWILQGSTGNFLPAADVVNDLGGTTTFVRDGYIRRRIGKIVAVTYSASMTPDASLGETQQITATNNTAFTINAPTSPLTGQLLTVTIRNTSGGALGAATWNAVFKMAAWTQPANGFSRSITFYYDGTNWIESDRTAVDIPN